MSAALSRRLLLGGLAGTALIGATPRARAATLPPAASIAADVRQEFLHGWNGYKQYAWGHDQVLPVSGGYQEFFADGHPIGLSIIEALDTLYVMELDQELALGTDWLTANVSFDIDADFHVFEAVIRAVGGLLAGYLATGNAGLLRLTTDLTDRLLPAFTKSPTGMPYTHVNLHSGAVSGSTVPLAEIGTNILEFGVLSQLTRDPKYYDAAKRAYQASIPLRSSLDLMGTSIDVEAGTWSDPTEQAPNPPVDSYYEYLWGGWALFGDRDLLDWYRLLTNAIITRTADASTGHFWFRQVDFRTGAPLGTAASELASFYAGLLAKSGDLTHGGAYYDSWTSVLDRYPVLPEEIDYATGAVTSASNNLRPEYANSAFDLYQRTGGAKYRTTAYQYFQGMKNLRVLGGYTIANDVTTTPMQLGDLTQAYWFADNMKYLWLIFANAPRYDYRTGYLSTEGKILRGLRRP